MSDLEDWIKVHEDGDPLWKLHRGEWAIKGLKIIDVKIDENGKTLWIKVG